MRLSQNGVNFIKCHEALRLKAYQDSKGVWTIGWGHTNALAAERGLAAGKGRGARGEVSGAGG